MELLRNGWFPEGLSLRRVCELMIYGRDPTLGYRRMKAILERRVGKKVNHKRVRRLTRCMGLKGISPAPKTTRTTETEYRNLLEHFNLTRPN